MRELLLPYMQQRELPNTYLEVEFIANLCIHNFKKHIPNWTTYHSFKRHCYGDSGPSTFTDLFLLPQLGSSQGQLLEYSSGGGENKSALIERSSISTTLVVYQADTMSILRCISTWQLRQSKAQYYGRQTICFCEWPFCEWTMFYFHAMRLKEEKVTILAVRFIESRLNYLDPLL